MKTFLFIPVLLVFNLNVQGQFLVVDSLSYDRNLSLWNVDELGYTYLINGNELIKLDTNHNVQFKQSVKSMGFIDRLEFINAQKILLFSIEQQQIQLLDNTLTNNGLSIDAVDLGFSNVTLVAKSSRPNLIWIYDQFNSSLHLYDIYLRESIQSVYNLKGILNLNEEILDLNELENNIYLNTIDEIVKLDLNLNFIDRFDRPFENSTLLIGDVFIKVEDTLFEISNLLTESYSIGAFPVQNCMQIRAVGSAIYAQNDKYIYTLKFE